MTHVEHLTLEQLGDLIDERLAGAEQGLIDEHLALCAGCAERLSQLETLIAAARDLPGEIAPPPTVWNAVRTQIQPVRATRRPFRWQLAAAAVLLVAASSAITAVVLRRPPVLVVRPSEPPLIAATVTLPAPARAIDADYGVTIRQLNETLAQRRAQLDPATIAKVESSLRIIDLAIGEARQALAGDPANLTLLDILAANYERKLELLRRASELPPST